MQLQLKTDLATALPNAIEFNFDELKAWLGDRLESYRGVLIAPEDIGRAKTDCADLNRVYKAIDDARKMVKKECLRPYEAFEAKAKILLGMISEVRDEQKKQLDAFEEDRRAKRRDEIEKAFKMFATAHGVADILRPSLIMRNEWLNKTATNWAVDLESAVSAFAAGLKTVRSLYGSRPDADRIVAAYAECGDINALAALVEKHDRRVAEIRAAREQEAQQREVAAPVPPPAPAPEEEPVLECALVFRGTRSALLALRAKMDALGIVYRKIAIPAETAK